LLIAGYPFIGKLSLLDEPPQLINQGFSVWADINQQDLEIDNMGGNMTKTGQL
jgi:hypothetical protein